MVTPGIAMPPVRMPIRQADAKSQSCPTQAPRYRRLAKSFMRELLDFDRGRGRDRAGFSTVGTSRNRRFAPCMRSYASKERVAGSRCGESNRGRFALESRDGD